MSARARRLTVVLAILLALGGPVAVAVATSGVSGPTYRIRSGDTITSIALQLHLPGGWQQLYDANRNTIGPDPNRLRVGEELAIPQDAVPATEGYVVQPGDTLSSVAGRMHIPGGGAALYAANKQVIGADPNRLEVGQTLVPPGTAVPPKPAVTQAQPPASTSNGQALSAQAPVAQGPAASAPERSSGSHGHPVLWAAAAAVLFLLLVLLVLFALPRLRRSRSQEVWVGGEFSADHQPAQRSASSEGSVVAAFRPASVRREAAPRTEPVESEPLQFDPVRSAPIQFQPVQSQPLQLQSTPSQSTPSQPVQLQSTPSQPMRSQPLRPAPVQPARRPSSAAPHRSSWFDRAASSDQGSSPERGAHPDGDLADELFGEVRLVDPSTPLTREQHAHR